MHSNDAHLPRLLRSLEESLQTRSPQLSCGALVRLLSFLRFLFVFAFGRASGSGAMRSSCDCCAVCLCGMFPLCFSFCFCFEDLLCGRWSGQRALMGGLLTFPPLFGFVRENEWI